VFDTVLRLNNARIGAFENLIMVTYPVTPLLRHPSVSCYHAEPYLLTLLDGQYVQNLHTIHHYPTTQRFLTFPTAGIRITSTNTNRSSVVCAPTKKNGLTMERLLSAWYDSLCSTGNAHRISAYRLTFITLT
jgi:hypothetical protein